MEDEPKKDYHLSMNLQFDEENHMFVISYVEENKAIFQVKMTPHAFEKMTHDMIRTVKNYNLYQAEQHMKNSQKAIENEEKIDPLVS